MTPRLLVPVGVSAAVGVLVGLAAFTRWRGEATAAEHEFVARLAEAERRLADVPLRPIGDGEVLARLFSAGLESGSPELTAAHRDDLARSAAEFLARRFGGGDTEAYIEWRRAAGYEPRSIEDLTSTWFIEQTAEVYFGSKDLSARPWDSVHAEFVAASDRFKGGRARIETVAASREGIATVTKRLTRLDPQWPPLGGAVGKALDFGGAIAMSDAWWSGPLDWKQRLGEGGSVTVGTLGFVAEFGNGQLRPVGLSFVLDPRSDRWFLVGAHCGTLTQDRADVVRLEY